MTTSTITPPTGSGTPARRRPHWLIVIGLVLALQSVLVLVGSWAPLSARLTGQEVRLTVAPLDPIDPFRGAYVALSYPDLPNPSSTGTPATRGTVYVPLTRRGDVWVGGPTQSSRPGQGPYLRCDQDWQLRCGIDSYFMPQADAARMDRELRDGQVTAVVRVDGRGNAALIRLEPDR